MLSIRISRHLALLQPNAIIKNPARNIVPSLLRMSYSTSNDSKSYNNNNNSNNNKNKGTILVLGGTGYLGQNVCIEAIKNGYSVVSLSRRGLPSLDDDSSTTTTMSEDDKRLLSPTSGFVDYRQGDARQKASITNILQDTSISQQQQQQHQFVGIVHCIGLLFDDASGLGSYNILVSGSKSVPDSDSTYDTITRITAFNAIDAAIEYAKQSSSSSVSSSFPFCFTSAAEAGWPQMTGGPFIESIMPEFIGRYMIAKRAVEDKLMNESQPTLRPIIVRPSLIYSPKTIASLPPVAAFTIANAIGVPFVDRPVTVTSLSKAIIRSIGDDSIVGVQRYKEIDKIGM
jgi:nucleoside-diphosphate-sugar epimerase